MAAPFFWLALWSYQPVALNLYWPLQAPLAFLLPALLYPVLEEVVFRGAIQSGLYDTRWGRNRWGPVSAANLLTSLLFAALHFIQHPPLWAALIFLPSLLFGYFRDRHQGLPAPVILHIFYNSGYFLLFPP